ncbi:MAG: CopG family transcriptional regulator [Spirochaetes bacterium]|nr:CopG family transcriptional regulator [Spirochaetota bacterium]
MTTIRLPDEIEKNIEKIAEFEHKTKSDIIKIALKEYLEKFNNQLSAYELGKDLFGKYGSGETSNSRNYKKIIKGKINDKIIN